MSEKKSINSIRIFSYNIHKGFNLSNRTFVLHQMKDSMRKFASDIVFLQEVQGEHTKRAQVIKDWPNESQFEFLARDLWPHISYGKNCVYAHGHHGNAILSAYPIISAENIDISAHRFESRGMLHAVLDCGASLHHVHCLCVHFGLFAKGRLAQIEQILKRVRKAVPEDAPLIVAGDFNDWSMRATRHLETEIGLSEVYCSQHGQHAKTYPSRTPVLALDRIYQRGFSVKSSAVLSGRPWSKLSDHSPLIAEVELNKK